ncbi:MAG: SdpI family protein [Gemmatimonadaceae bacterium]
MRRLPEVLVLVICILSVAAFPHLPAQIAGDVSWLLPSTLSESVPAREASRVFLAFAIPAVLALMLAAFRWATSDRGRATTARVLPAWLGTPGGRAPEYEKFSASLDLIMLCVTAIAASVHMGFLASALGRHGPISALTGLGFGVALAAMGNVMPRLRPNPIAGLRSEAMLRNPSAWRNAHASFGRMWVLGGVLVIGTALVAPRYSLIAFVAVVVLSVIVAPIVARRALSTRHKAAEV